MILLSRYYREANIDQLVILKYHGEKRMSMFYLPLGKKNAQTTRWRKSPGSGPVLIVHSVPPSDGAVPDAREHKGDRHRVPLTV